MTDSVPAPMVQVPAETVEKLREAVADWEASDDNDSYADLTLATAAHRLVDAASPAASVPAADYVRVETAEKYRARAERLAADILALAEKKQREADHWTEEAQRRTGEERVSSYALASKYSSQASELRTLVAAAEQADKGEAADTPRRKCYACGSTLEPDEHGELEWCPKCEPAESRPAPAAPVGEPLCRCGHTYREHGYLFPGGPCGAQFDGCEAFEPRVPVNDEAEAAWQRIRDGLPESFWTVAIWKSDGNWEAGSLDVANRHHIGVAIITAMLRAARGEDA